MKKFITIAAAAAFLTLGTANVNAQSSSDLQDQINALLAQLSSLQGGTSMVSGSMLSTYSGTMLRVGSQGQLVVELQNCMNTAGYSTGYADGKFGPNTKTGVMAFQASQGLAVDGIVGPATWPKFQAACPTGTTVVVDEDEDETPSESMFDTNDGEEADFSNTDVNDADDDTIEEGENKAELAEIDFELEEGGAALLERFDVVLDYVGVDNADEDDAWEVFDTIYLMVDGDIIAEEDADDEDDWDDSSVGDETRFRISGINHVFDAEEDHTITVVADLAGSIDLGSDEQANWELTVLDNSLRFVDEAGITVYLDEESQASTDTASFTIETEGQDDELDVKSSNNDPESTTLKVEDDKSSDDYTVFVFELEADEDSSDLDIDKLSITVDVTGTDHGPDDDAATTGDNVAATFDDIVKDAMIMIDGEEFDDIDTYVDGTSVTLVFDIDEDFTLDSGDNVDVELVLEFNSANGENYIPGATVKGSIGSGDVTAEGADDLVSDGSATGDVHTLLVEGINAETTSTDANIVVVDGATNDYAEFEINLDVEAFESDAFISENAANSIVYSIVDANTGVVFGGGTRVASLSSSADLEGSYYRVNENDSEEFTFSVSFTPGAAGSYRMRIDSIEFNTAAAAPNDSYLTIPAQDYRTGNANITG
jgi:hypothetical protein